MEKIFYQSDSEHDLLLGMEFGIYKKVDTPKQANIIFSKYPKSCNQDQTLKELTPDQLILITDLWHGFEKGANYIELFEKFLTQSTHGHMLILCQYQKFSDIEIPSDRIHILKYDIMFNRQKAYYTQLPFRNHFMIQHPSWYWAGEQCYKIAHWSRESKDRSKIFLSAGRPWVNRPFSIRHTLQKHLEKHTDLGYLAIYDSIVDDNSVIGLYSHKEDPLSNGQLQFDVSTGKTFELSQFTSVGDTSVGDTTRGFSPIHINYYENSFISIYEETLSYGTNNFITEKTYTPLIQGHFILPFSSAGTIKTIQRLGFQLPDFIDYSYDNIDDLDQRKKVYINEVDRLINQPLKWWNDRRNENLDLLFHNRKIFWLKPYDQFLPTANSILQNKINSI